MGVDAGDYDNDGRMDLVVTNFEKEPISLYRNAADGYFLDNNAASRLGPAASRSSTSACRCATTMRT